jgi:hypothetical protein
MIEETQLDQEPGERPMTHDELSTPEMQAAIAKARKRIATSDGSPGKTADDLLKLAREQRGVGTRT